MVRGAGTREDMGQIEHPKTFERLHYVLLHIARGQKIKEAAGGRCWRRILPGRSALDRCDHYHMT